ncbi:hypothetical protein GCM10011579_067010 [Streptomyces albiflavescens]|uniref:Uncharacterized protein n=1 Tax=Streptomyces albiflavescens TaxID=1623582 RepID=A0A918D7R1_9ACTN|nr:hypothetical protein [Streptomyces albiflavescens]GGN80937.1 hypothetical protein GCM10011579_067010 [Streptomyces albiflavescens]
MLFVAVWGPTGAVVDEPDTEGADVREALCRTAVAAALEPLRDHVRPTQLRH